VTFLRHDLFTNGVLYVDLALSMKNLPARLLPYLPLFWSVLSLSLFFAPSFSLAVPSHSLTAPSSLTILSLSLSHSSSPPGCSS